MKHNWELKELPKNATYVIEKNGSYLNELFVDDIDNNGFTSTNIRSCYKYNITDVAYNISLNLNANLIMVG